MMELLDRYLAAVQQELPLDRQQDIIRELRANLLDMIEARAEQQNGELSTAELTALLQQHGHPVDVAQRFAPDAPLVAAEDMPLLRTVLWHGAAVLLVLALLQTCSGMLQDDSLNPVRLLLQTFSRFVDNFAVLLLVVIAVFYSCGRAGLTQKWRQRRWQLADLPRYPQARLQLSDGITDLTSALFLLMLLWTPLWMSAQAQADLLVHLADGLEGWRYGLSIMCVGSALFALYRLTQRSWQRWSLALYIFEHLLFAAVFVALALLPELLVQTRFVSANGWIWPRLESILDSALLVTAAILLWLALLELRRFRQLG